MTRTRRSETAQGVRLDSNTYWLKMACLLTGSRRTRCPIYTTQCSGAVLHYTWSQHVAVTQTNFEAKCPPRQCKPVLAANYICGPGDIVGRILMRLRERANRACALCSDLHCRKRTGTKLPNMVSTGEPIGTSTPPIAPPKAMHVERKSGRMKGPLAGPTTLGL